MRGRSCGQVGYVLMWMGYALGGIAPLRAETAWRGYAHDPQHTAISPVASRCLTQIRWQTPVDLAPPYWGDELFIHYGSPLITPSNTVLIPVRTDTASDYRIEARRGSDGVLLWTQTTDYVLPPHNWIPSYAPVLTATGRLYYAGKGGTVFWRENVDQVSGPGGQLVFYGLGAYQANASQFGASVFINTPITADASGNIYFGFQVTGSNPVNLVSGLAKIDASGAGTWVSAAAAAGDPAMTKVAHNCSPAISNDGNTVYVAISNGNGLGWGQGYLVALSAATLSMQHRVQLRDPVSNLQAYLPEDGTASPTVGPDGDVYYGVLENPFPSNNDRGWLLHFSSDLTQTKIPGAFGWDDTASVVPASMVPSYTGHSPYLLMTKYNNYAGVNTGNGVNRIAVIDPRAGQVDGVTGATVMKEVVTAAGVTPDDEHTASFPSAVREWCINTAVVDPLTRSILVNNEDGKLYRWDMQSNALVEPVTLTSGVGEAYTPTVIGVDGTVYAINNATLFAVGGGVPADFNCDGAVNDADVQILIGCMTGPNSGPTSSGCGRPDLDHDLDVDQSDFGSLQVQLQ